MSEPVPSSIAAHFRQLPDPRVRRTRRHALEDILVITLCAVICGANDWASIVRFGRAKRKWFRGFLALPHGIPSHGTFGRVFAALDPEAVKAALSRLGRHGGGAAARGHDCHRRENAAPGLERLKRVGAIAANGEVGSSS